MVEFYLLFAITMLLCVRSLIALLLRRFPHPADLALLSTAYYTVPLATAAYLSYNYRGLIFLSPEAADAGLALTGMRFVTVAMICLEAGRYAGKIVPVGAMRFYANLNEGTHLRASLWFPALLGMLALGIALFGWKEFLSGYASEVIGLLPTIGNGLIFSSVELLGLTTMVTLLLGQRFGSIPMKPLIFATIMALIFVLAFRAKRLEVVTATMPAFLILFSSRSWISNPLTRLVLAGLGLLLLVIVSAIRVSDDVNLGTLTFYSLTEGLYAGHSLPGIINRLEAGYIGYEYGMRFAYSIIGFVPRFLWETKDELLLAGNAALDGVSPLGATSFLGEVVLQGGFLAVAIVYFALGWIFQRSMAFERIWDKALASGVLPLRFGFYIVLTAIFIPHFRDGIIPAIKLSLQAMIFLLLIAGVRFSSRVYKTSRGQVARA
jgi:hypothetical protein